MICLMPSQVMIKLRRPWKKKPEKKRLKNRMNRDQMLRKVPAAVATKMTVLKVRVYLAPAVVAKVLSQ